MKFDNSTERVILDRSDKAYNSSKTTITSTSTSQSSSAAATLQSSSLLAAGRGKDTILTSAAEKNILKRSREDSESDVARGRSRISTNTAKTNGTADNIHARSEKVNNTDISSVKIERRRRSRERRARRGHTHTMFMPY